MDKQQTGTTPQFSVHRLVLDSGERLPCLVDHETWLPARVATRWAMRYRRYRRRPNPSSSMSWRSARKHSGLTTLDSLARLYQDQGRDEEAEPLYRRALTINEKALPPDHPYTTAALENYATLLRELNRPREAQPLEQRAQAMRARLSSKKNM